MEKYFFFVILVLGITKKLLKKGKIYERKKQYTRLRIK